MADDDMEEITASDHAQLGTEPVGVYLSQEDALEVAEILQAASPANEELPRLMKLLAGCETAEAALHVTIADA